MFGLLLPAISHTDMVEDETMQILLQLISSLQYQMCPMEILFGNNAIGLISIIVYVAMLNCLTYAQMMFSYRCADDQYEHTNSSGDIECRRCTSCPPGFGVIKLCATYNDTICEPCPLGSYSMSSSPRDSCIRCRECGNHQLKRTNCTPTNDRECSRSCSTGYYFDNILNRCFKCGYCYSGYGTPVRVSDCNVKGVAKDYQCRIIRNHPNPHDRGRIRQHGEGNINNVKDIELTTERLLPASSPKRQASHIFTTEDIFTDVYYLTGEEPVSLSNMRVDNIEPQNSDDTIILVTIGICVVMVAMFVTFYFIYTQCNFNKGTRNEVLSISENVFSGDKGYSAVSTTDVLSNVARV